MSQEPKPIQLFGSATMFNAYVVRDATGQYWQVPRRSGNAWANRRPYIGSRDLLHEIPLERARMLAATAGIPFEA